MEIIGTGLSGLVGSRFVELFPQHQFHDLSRHSGHDILKPSTLEPVFINHPQASAVIHLAAFTDTRAAWQQRGDKNGFCYQLNVTGTENIVNLCKKYQKYLIYVSTDFVFDGTKNGPYTETDTPHPIEWYGETKLRGEQIVSTKLSDFAIARISFPYRASYDLKKDLIRRIIDDFQYHRLKPFFVDQTITPTFIDDIATGINFLCQEQSTGIFHLVGSSFSSPYDLAREIALLFDFDPREIRRSTLSDYFNSSLPNCRPWQKNLSLSNQKITSLGVRFSDLNEGLLRLKSQL
ncbi:sugar nucleotide-binding protein [Patescibacteria group bacterium]|nr:sugar nucleotide-binding protein [Patescibacteria group bacterium]